MKLSYLLSGGLLVALALAAIFTGNGYQLYILSLVGLTAIVGIGLNILVGMSGQISLGHVAFYAIGSYTVAILTVDHGVSFWLALPIAGLLAGVAGGLLSIPALRVRGPYLAMITIAFGFIVEQSAAELDELTGGWNGIMGIRPPELFGFGFSQREIAIFVLVLMLVALGAYALISRSPWGKALRALRDSEVAAQSIGLNPVLLRCVAFALSAVFAGIAGGVYGTMSGFISPESFPFFESILFLLVVMIGGADTILGPVIGAIIVVLLPEVFASLAEYRLLFVGILLLVVLRLAPRGIVGSVLARWRRSQPDTPPAVAAEPDLPRWSGGGKRLEVQDVSISFGGVKAVQGLSFTAEPGRITSIIGPNGAGKTTALNLIAGYYAPDSGRVMLDDEDLTGRSSHKVARAGVARTYQTTQLFEHMSVLDNLLMAMVRGRVAAGDLGRSLETEGRRGKAEALLAFVGYRGDIKAPAGTLAHIDKRLVEIARALAFDPDIVLLDEPAAGLGEEDTAHVARLLQRLAQAGITVILIEHDMGLVMGISDHVLVLDSGQKISEGEPAVVRRDPAVLAAYLGEGAAAMPVRSAPGQKGDVAIAVEGLSASYGASEVLHGIELSVAKGELVAVLGANGAGKSTLMRALSGLHRPVAGKILFQGDDIQELAADRIARRGLVLVPEGRQVFPELSVVQNIRLGAYGRHTAGLDAQVERMLDRFPRLRERQDQRAGLLSGGEQQMLAIARGLVARPEVLLLDEPSLGLAPSLIQELYTILAELRDGGATILLVDQMAEMALAIADRAYVLSSGAIVAGGTPEEIRDSRLLEDAYLGDAESAAS
ncbi:branched-chain amino acid ABC transporter ATP-binding protein/permease [Amorphus orientalis]|uniref:ABC-type branched-subunit amino acid transport system ATPase component/ABC-type branched-subunit amino acid transport system permease subunit n=1 Tax=Amorphus orientalis TaxID=649198 RepID=A0AAE4ARU5_9HYPH|nr:branched-chain amino acid ABC transporter ATP-binding protein/permease [Amorphus orientalis]MDQ0314473.1 ABC-type branched-subunit amino acid transport system ATPase component/ABC-type branched-subunit amino acid transport system permease subunit [Amorphus orientalis]